MTNKQKTFLSELYSLLYSYNIDKMIIEEVDGDNYISFISNGQRLMVNNIDVNEGKINDIIYTNREESINVTTISHDIS